MPKRKASRGSDTDTENTVPPKQRTKKTQSTQVTAVTDVAAPTVSDITVSESKGDMDHSVINAQSGHQRANHAEEDYVHPSFSDDKVIQQLGNFTMLQTLETLPDSSPADKSESVSDVGQVDEDSDLDIGDYSSMEQPPLIKQLKTILAEYPDDGQIIKELLQNAEDAGANEVKILYDDRHVNIQKDNIKRNYRKFFRGPALCLFNDASFTDSDWTGIKMIYSSVKEKDPLKVGRFGLGFKSVFHITDNLVVLSGDRILFIDPHRSTDCVCLTIPLSKLKKWKKLKIEDILMALDGTFGVSKVMLETGRYNGTLFWFPLRSKASKLSDTVYSREKVMDLFTSFRTEASSILVFLKHLTKVSLHERMKESNIINLKFSLELVGNIDEVKEVRNTFLTKIRNLKKSVADSSIDCRYLLSFCAKSFDGNIAVNEITTDWMVANYYKGGTTSEDLRTLIQDDSLGYVPLVSVAAPVGENRHGFKGHVFCFLPLPQKAKSTTGLPVHVNGFFALSQNRQHIKWPSAEQIELHLHKDKSLLWNEKLLTELLPDAYEILITEMINHATRNGNPHDLVECIYATIPRIDNVADEWYALLPCLFDKITSRPTLMTVNMSGGKSWISCLEAFFATFRNHNNLALEVKKTLVKTLQLCDKRYVDLPLSVFMSYSKFKDTLTDMNTHIFADVLKENSTYKSLSRDEKLHILQFLTLDSNYVILEDLELLPLEDGSFTQFVSTRRTSHQVLLCSKKEIELFPGFEKMFVYQAHEHQWLEKHVQEIVKQGLYHIERMNAETFQTLIEKVIKEHFGTLCPPIITDFSVVTGCWIQMVWEHICLHKYDVGLFQYMPLIPLLKTGSWSDIKETELYQLKDSLIVKQTHGIPSLHDGVYRCLQSLSVKVLPSLPLWLQTSEILKYFHYSTVNGVIELLGRINCSFEKEKLVSTFNCSCVEQDKKEFVNCIAGCSTWNPDSISLVRCLKIFTESSSLSRNVSVQENTTVIMNVKYPVKFPRPCIIGSFEECRMACTLGARELDRNSLILETLQTMHGESYSLSEKQIFMQYFIQHIGEHMSNENLLSMASGVAFLTSNITHAICKPADLFDPLDSSLQELFQGENKFPIDNWIKTNTNISALKTLGLKSYHDVTANDLCESAGLIETWCEHEAYKHLVPDKAKRLLESLINRPALLGSYVHGETLKSKLMNMRCIQHATTKPQNFPSVLPWFQQQQMLSKPSKLRLITFSRLVGSIMPLIDCQSEELSSAFGWKQNLPQNKVVEQFRLLINVYQDSCKPELLPIVQEIYQEFSTYKIHELLADPNFQSLFQKGCIWRGDGFSTPQEIFLESNRNDLNLTPYLYKLPEEFKRFESLFCGLGCNKEQNVDVLLQTQVVIKEKYAIGKYSKYDVRNDLSILISILNRLRQEKSRLKDRLHDILFPIHCDNELTLVLKPGPECTYCNAQWLREMTEEDKDEEDIFYVHEDVSNMTAEELGVKSLTQQLLSDTEELVMEEWGQEEPLTTRLHRLLKEGYQDGFSVPKEILQNADDAGAKRVYFLYDERENEDAKTNLWDEGMAECQGRAIWAYNDAQFETKDFKNITRLNAATKKDEFEKIGKFGLGFCSVYNLTDVPSFISGSNIVIFDPHKSHLGKALPGSSPGMKIDFGKLKNMRMMKRLKNQFKPFENVFGYNMSCNFHGTLFRFPLRTASQAQKSEICDKYYSRKECLELLHMTIKAAGNLLLFTQNVQEIKIFHLSADCKDPQNPKIIYTMSKEHFQDQTQPENGTNILSYVSNLKLNGELGSRPLKRLQKITILEKIEKYAGSILPSLIKESGMSYKASWLISWATGTDETLKTTFRDVVGALPLGAVAVPFEMRENLLCPVQLKDLPFGFYKSGHVFCFLPLPIPCNLPVHINGCFAVTSDRRQLMQSTEDEKQAQFSNWNKALIQDALINAYICLLEGIRENGAALEYEYYTLWPLECQQSELHIKETFFQKIVQLELRLFRRNSFWQSFDKCIFLDPSFRTDHVIGEIAFETLLTFHSRNSEVIELPPSVMESIKACYPNEMKAKIVTKEQFFLSVFLPNIQNEFWSQSSKHIHKRNKLVLYAIKLDHKAVKEALSYTKCIPSEPNGVLKCPNELINPCGQLSDMFTEKDEVFPRGGKTFRKTEIIKHLVGLGMVNKYLPFPFLEDRCQSVIKNAEICGQCAIERCSKILKYLSGINVREKLEKNHDDLQKLRNLTFLPVLHKPSRWKFSWRGNTEKHGITKTCNTKHLPKIIRLDSPANLFRQCTEKLVGCVELIWDETSITATEASIQPLHISKLLRLKGSIKSDVPCKTVVKQLITIAQEYNSKQSKDANDSCKAICSEIYSFLDKMCERSDEITKASINTLSKEEILLLGEQMIDSSRVAFNLRHNCSPELFGLHGTDLEKHKHFLKTIGIKNNFDVGCIVRVLGHKRRQSGLNPLSVEDIDLVHGLLSALQDSMGHEGVQYKDLDESLLTDIVAPDTDNVLRETRLLCLDDSEFETGPGTKTIHCKYSAELALAMGVKTKRRKCFDELSFLIPGGQKEKLVTRLRGILSAYPCDDGIMRELLQNADDAQASEIHFIKDYRTHGCEKIFDEKYAPLQGPALCVFNNSAFTKADIEGIHDLGLGSKREDPLKTGQYGVGFNAVYHLTDAPSFLTKGPELDHREVWCMFDPTCQYLPKVTEQDPGVHCLVAPIRKNYPDVLKGYLEEDLFTSDVGTMFRFPLQSEKTLNKTHVSSNRVDKIIVNDILKKFCDDSFEAILFLKHVSKITVSNISSGTIKEEYIVETKLSQEDRKKRDEFFQFVKTKADQYKKDRTSIINMSSAEVSYAMTVRDTRGESKYFCIVQRMGFKDGFVLPETVVHALKDSNLGQLPIGGVAFAIPNKQKMMMISKKHNYYRTGRVEKKNAVELNEINGRAFCFLPLPIRTGLPCHINGHFVLDHEARRTLWKEHHGYRRDWNHCIFESIVSPAYITALIFLKEHLFHDLSKQSLEIVRRLLDCFLSCFPLMTSAREDDWKAIVKYVYATLYSEEVQLFPVVQECDGFGAEHQFDEASVEWTALQMSREIFPAYFHIGDPTVSKILKQLGMKIIEIPDVIMKSVEQSGINTEIIHPSSVLKFLKSFNSTGLGKCNLEVNVPLAETKFVSIGKVRSILDYIAHANNLETEINNTALLVTNDGVLRQFSNTTRTICSPFWDLLPYSSEQFVHAELRISYQSQIFWKQGMLLNLTLHRFINLLPSTLSSEVFQEGQDVIRQASSQEIPNEIWILRFWKFIYDLSVESTQFGTNVINQEFFKNNMAKLSQWSLLPVQHSDDKLFIMRPISKAYTILDISSFDRMSDLGCALEKLNLPKLYTVMLTERGHADILRMMRSIVSSKIDPLKVLKCIHYHKYKIRNSGLTLEECNAILVFFSTHMSLLRQHADELFIRNCIKALPLHITLQGTSISLDGNENVFVLPLGMPVEGVQELATSSGYILLRQNNDLVDMHNLLQLTLESTINVYCSIILPKFDTLPTCYHLQHLFYIKDTLLRSSYSVTGFNQTQQQLINILKATPFISTGDRMKLASEFFDPYHKVFSCMCNENEFPPSPFNNRDWIEFMRLAGLKKEVSQSMFLEFAESLAREGAYQYSENLCKKSKILVDFFWSSFLSSWKSRIIERLATVKFIPPHYVSNETTSLYKHYSDRTKLICFSQSTRDCFELLCWTSMNLLPKWACPEPELSTQILQTLGVHLRPPVERVVLQCQNVCDAQKKIFSNNHHEKSDITSFSNLLDQIYVYLSEHKSEDPRIKEKLANTPVVFLPKSRLLLPAKNIVVELSKEESVEPYLCKAPDFYGRYNDFFIFLGASQQVSLNHYCLVLRLVHQMQSDHNEKLLLPEMITVQKTVRNIVALLVKEQQLDFDEEILYLPDKSERLRNSQCLIVADNRYLESRLKECNLTYFIGFKELEVTVLDPRQVVKSMPDRYRPKLLSEVAKEVLDTIEMNEIESDEAVRLERFLHSNEFIQGISRLVKHEKTLNGQMFTSNDANSILKHIQGVRIKEVQGLYTYLKIDGQRIESSKQRKDCVISETINEHGLSFTLYFQAEEGRKVNIQRDLLTKPDGVIGLIKRCTNNSIQQRTEALYEILNCLQESYEIDYVLDKLDIDPYDAQQNIPCSIFPRPGTYVPLNFHAFLQQGFSEFQEHEYDSVAYELEDNIDESDSDNTVYIYVRIIRPEKSMDPSATGIKKQYLINIGDEEKGHIIVYAYKLFKFERKPVSTSQDLLPSDALPVGSLPCDDICRQILNILREAWTLPKEERRRVLKRLLLRWHPDKNIGQEDYCNRIFNYIQNVVLQLDSGQPVHQPNNTFKKREGRRVFTGTAYENLGRRVNIKTTQYRDEHRQHEDAYYETHSRRYYVQGRFYALPPVPDQSNAQRWLRQAKKDISSAKDFLPPASSAPAFNWICYHCHQATEKALKAAVYAIDANKVNQKSHKLADIARNGGLIPDLLKLAKDVEDFLGEHTKMRYPDSISRTEIPAELYTEEQARTTLKITEKVIQLVDENYLD
ncbi:hypothetical protein CHS0354_039261 [Potamilus streckersoni]|uniref:HEPN domain-containing protein n=1 Tax=Potamilus streckersoni TaxID=2493646 RepID=A0AAE0S334_9BIVA|nr:hypothetical protein CHS0354_039261 [Potamilus streckersoni]